MQSEQVVASSAARSLSASAASRSARSIAPLAAMRSRKLVPSLVEDTFQAAQTRIITLTKQLQMRWTGLKYYVHVIHGNAGMSAPPHLYNCPKLHSANFRRLAVYHIPAAEPGAGRSPHEWWPSSCCSCLPASRKPRLFASTAAMSLLRLRIDFSSCSCAVRKLRACHFKLLFLQGHVQQCFQNGVT